MTTKMAVPFHSFVSIVNALTDAVLIVDSNHRITYCNQTAQQMFGYGDEEMQGRILADVIQGDDTAYPPAIAVDDKSGEFSAWGFRKGQSRFPVRVSFMSLEDSMELKALVIRDITHKKLSDHRLRVSQQLGNVGTWERDLKTGRLYWSDEMFRIFGIERREHFTYEEYLTNCVHPEDRSRVQKAMELADNGDPYDLEYRLVRPSGDVRWIHVQGQLDPTGDLPYSVLGCVKDITLYRQSIEDLKRSKDNLKLAQSVAKLGHWDWDVENDTIFWSDETYAIVGLDLRQLGKTYQDFLSLVHDDDRDFVHGAIQSALGGSDLDMQYRYRRSSGEYCVLHVVGKLYVDAHGAPIRLFGTCQDITDRHKTEEMLIRSEKLAVVGQLAAGFAHEIRNPLTALRGFTQLLQDGSRGTGHAYSDIMMSELDRIGTIVDKFLVFAKPQALSTRIVVVETLIKEVIELFRPQALLQNSEFVIHLDDVTWINCEPNQLKQVFVNIIKNAFEAMPRGGTLTVKLHRAEAKVRIEFTDQGAGIPQALISQIGQPFYTTKDAGTGLGLMVSQKIIAEHAGYMEITSDVGVGTTIFIELPIVTNVPPEVKP